MRKLKRQKYDWVEFGKQLVQGDFDLKAVTKLTI